MSGRLSLFAGAGALVPHVIAAAQQAGFKVQVLTLVPRTDLGGVKIVAADISRPLGIIWSLKTFRTSHIVMAGGIVLSDREREGLAHFAGGGGKAAAASGMSTGDAALSGLGKALETMTGAALVGVHDIAPDLLAEAGHIAGPRLSEPQLADAIFALGTAREIGRFDIGQGVVATGRRVIAVEDVAGTDALLERVASYRDQGLTGDGSHPLILAKAAKPQQPLFVDLPAIGPETIANARRAGIFIIAVQAGRALLLERVRLLAAAEAAGVTLVGLALGDD